MANTLRFKRGLVSGIPTAALGEPLFTTDTFDLYIGNGTGNTRFQKYIASGTTSQILRGDGSLYTFPLAISSPTTGQVLKYNGTSWVNDSDAGITGSGTTNYLPKFTGATTLGNSNLINDASGNLGLGVTPSAWYSTVKAIEVNTLGSISQNGGPNGRYSIAYNATQTGALHTTGWVYNVNDFAVQYKMNQGQHQWFNAPSGTAGNAITFTQAMTLFNTGNLAVGSTTDNGLRFQVTGDGYFSGSVGIGSTALTNRALSIIKTMTGSTDGYGILQYNTVSSGVTASAINNYSQFVTQATAFTLTNAYHYYHADISVGAGSTITNQYGYFVSSIQSATNNYGFYGNIASGTGRWNLYMNGTANNYMAGSLGIGSSSLTNYTIRSQKTMTGAVAAYGVMMGGQIQSDVTTVASYYRTAASTQATSFTLIDLHHFFADGVTIGAGSAVTNQYGFLVNSNLTGATNNYGFYGNIAAATGRWNLYMNGTANNYLAGNLGIGITTPAGNLDVYNATSSSIYNRVGAAGANWVTTSTQSQIGTYTNHNFVIKTNDTARINITNGGNVLIYSTTDLGQKLQVTGDGYFSGSVGIGTTALTDSSMRLGKNITGAVVAYGILNAGIVQSDVTSIAYVNRTFTQTQATAFTLNSLVHYGASQSTIGAGSTVTNQFGFFVDNTLIGATNNYGFYGNIASGTGRWNLYMNGSAANFLNGNLGIGVTPSIPLDIAGTSVFGIRYNRTDGAAGDARIILQSGTASTNIHQYGQSHATLASIFRFSSSGGIEFMTSGVAAARFSTAQNLTLGGTVSTDSGERLQVNGTMRVSGASTFSSSVTAGGNLLLTNGTASSVGAINLIRTGTSPVASRLTFGTDGTGYSFAIGKNQGGTVTDLLTILDSGLATFTDNARFKNNKGILFENASASPVGSIKMGTSVTNNLEITNGTHTITLATIGTFVSSNLLVGATTIGTSSTNTIAVVNGTAPTSSATDIFHLYSADVTAGNAAPHFRTENGAIIKLYQETTAVGNSTISVGGGNAVLDDTEFDGYTLRQIVRALRNQGILQ